MKLLLDSLQVVGLLKSSRTWEDFCDDKDTMLQRDKTTMSFWWLTIPGFGCDAYLGRSFVVKDLMQMVLGPLNDWCIHGFVRRKNEMRDMMMSRNPRTKNHAHWRLRRKQTKVNNSHDLPEKTGSAILDWRYSFARTSWIGLREIYRFAESILF
jgi:hypothetical protein